MKQDWDIDIAKSKHKTSNYVLVYVFKFNHPKLLVHVNNTVSSLNVANDSKNFILQFSEFHEVCYISSTPYMVAISKIGIYKRIIQGYQCCLEIFSGFDDHTNATRNLSSDMIDMVFLVYLIIDNHT